VSFVELEPCQTRPKLSVNPPLHVCI
jgi:hypothetical protein